MSDHHAGAGGRCSSVTSDRAGDVDVQWNRPVHTGGNHLDRHTAPDGKEQDGADEDEDRTHKGATGNHPDGHAPSTTRHVVTSPSTGHSVKALRGGA